MRDKSKVGLGVEMERSSGGVMICVDHGELQVGDMVIS